MSVRARLLSYALSATPNEVTIAKSGELLDAYRAEVLREAATFAGELAEQFRGTGGEMAEDREWGAAQVSQKLFNLAERPEAGAR